MRYFRTTSAVRKITAEPRGREEPEMQHLVARSTELADLAATLKRLQNENDRFLAAHFADAIDLDTLKRHQDRIRTGITDIDRRINHEHDEAEAPRAQITAAPRLLIDCARLYARTNDQGRRPANQAFTSGIEISEDKEATIRLAEPFTIVEPTPTHIRGSIMSSMVELRGLEPLTPCLQSRCATNCAIAPSGWCRIYSTGSVMGCHSSSAVDRSRMVCQIKTAPAAQAATTEARTRNFFISPPVTSVSATVGLAGLEPATSVLSGLRSNQLSYRPVDTVKA